MRISVAMAIYDGERWLPPLLESLARQTLPPDEVVVCDDASTDGTGAMLEAFGDVVSFPVRVFRNASNRGHTESFIAAAERCEGDVIAFCDADDVWVDHKLERCRREMEESGATLVLHTTEVVDEQLRPLGRHWPDLPGTRTFPPLGFTALGQHAPGMAMVVDRAVLDPVPWAERPPSRYGLSHPMFHDEWVLFVAGVLGRIRTVDEPLLLYRQHGSNVSGGWAYAPRRLTLKPVTGNYRDAAEHTAACAAYLAAAAERGGPWADRLRRGAEEYGLRAENWRARIELYAAADRRTRARLLRRLVAADAYAPLSAGGFGRAALGKDIAAGVALRVPSPDRA